MPTDWWRVKTTAAFFNELNRYTQPTSSTNLGYDNDTGTLAASSRNSYFLELQNDFTLWSANTLTFGGALRVNTLDLSTKNLAYYRSWDETLNKIDEKFRHTNTCRPISRMPGSCRRTLPSTAAPVSTTG